MIPLIDVVFLLLVAFICFAMSMTVYRGLPVDLPVSSAARVGDGDISEITVARSGAVHFNREAVDLPTLRLRLTRLRHIPSWHEGESMRATSLSPWLSRLMVRWRNSV